MSNINPITEECVNMFAGGSTVEDIAETLDISTKSVITRLSRLGVYVKPIAEKAPQKRGVKAELLQQLANALEVEPDALKTLSIATIEAILAKV
jgi:hypothetical protein